MNNSKNHHDLSDHEMIKLVCNKGRLIIHLKDWKENNYTILFDEVYNFSSHASFGSDLSHLSINAVNQLDLLLGIESEGKELNSYTFIDCKDDHLLTVFADGFRILEDWLLD